jgi:hypothetical protein
MYAEAVVSSLLSSSLLELIFAFSSFAIFSYSSISLNLRIKFCYSFTFESRLSVVSVYRLTT